MDFDRLARDVDRLTGSVEDETLRSIRAWLRPIWSDLNRNVPDVAREMRRFLGDDDVAKAVAEARAVRLAAEAFTLDDLLAAGPDERVQEAFLRMHREAYEAGVDTASANLDEVRERLPPGTALETFRPTPDLDRIRSLAQDSVARLHRHSVEDVQKIQAVLVDELTRGAPVGRMTERVRKATNLLEYEAERIVRTEAMSSTDDARRRTFGASGIEHVQRIATNDERVCEFCAERDGYVYRLADDPRAVLHPNCRCVLVPWSENWPADVRGDEDHRHRRATAIAEAQAEDPDFEPNPGPAPMERMEDRDAPVPYWTP